VARHCARQTQTLSRGRATAFSSPCDVDQQAGKNWSSKERSSATKIEFSKTNDSLTLMCGFVTIKQRCRIITFDKDDLNATGITGALPHLIRVQRQTKPLGNQMKIALIGAALVALAVATPAMAQAVITDPGRCAQYYSDANCQNLGAGNPYTNGGYWGPGWQAMHRPLSHHYARHHE
jgi:hypothetical protein